MSDPTLKGPDGDPPHRLTGARMLDLGPRCDPTSLDPLASRATLDPAALTRHAVCLGATGSGKTGLCVGLLESIALHGVPILAIDPKGDLTNIALVLDTPDRLAPWIPDEAARRAIVADWARALQDEGRGGDPARFRSTVDVSVLTPGSEAGIPVDVLTALTAPPRDLDPEGLREYVTGAVAALLGLIRREGDPLTDPAAILLARLLGDAFAAGRPLPLEALIPAVVDPPFSHVGMFPVDTFLPREERVDLARALNAVVSSPAFAPWRMGVPLDVEAWLTPVGGRTPVRVIYLSHLDDAQRMFFVTLLLHAVVAWSRRLPGAGALRALVYFDEVMGYLPPHPRDPPSKAPVLTLLKQARAVGVGVMLCTQNPVDMDYKAMSNAGTWLVGRLATRQDRSRVVDGLEEREELGQLLSRLPARTFLLRDERGVRVLRSRHTLSVLRGPLTRREVGLLGQRWSGQPTAPVRVAPPLPGSLPARWLAAEGVAAVGDGVGEAFRALVYGRLQVPGGVVHRAAWGDTLDEVRELVLEDPWLRKAPGSGAYGPAPAALHNDVAVTGLAARWAGEVAIARGLRRFQVEVVGVVVVWVRRVGV
jgi:hypothetical protein